MSSSSSTTTITGCTREHKSQPQSGYGIRLRQARRQTARGLASETGRTVAVGTSSPSAIRIFATKPKGKHATAQRARQNFACLSHGRESAKSSRGRGCCVGLTVVLALEIHRGLVGLDLAENVSGGDFIALLHSPRRNRAGGHGRRQGRQPDDRVVRHCAPQQRGGTELSPRNSGDEKLREEGAHGC